MTKLQLSITQTVPGCDSQMEKEIRRSPDVKSSIYNPEYNIVNYHLNWQVLNATLTHRSLKSASPSVNRCKTLTIDVPISTECHQTKHKALLLHVHPFPFDAAASHGIPTQWGKDGGPGRVTPGSKAPRVWFFMKILMFYQTRLD